MTKNLQTGLAEITAKPVLILILNSYQSITNKTSVPSRNLDQKASVSRWTRGIPYKSKSMRNYPEYSNLSGWGAILKLGTSVFFTVLELRNESVQKSI
ncbi:MAG TPA: hypothetical protein VH413_03980 [Verrucomicrobiae bacterium]|nr:hypothetical protein [Verrucomicrobiae bacterium]